MTPWKAEVMTREGWRPALSFFAALNNDLEQIQSTFAQPPPLLHVLTDVTVSLKALGSLHIHTQHLEGALARAINPLHKSVTLCDAVEKLFFVWRWLPRSSEQSTSPWSAFLFCDERGTRGTSYGVSWPEWDASSCLFF